MKKETLIWILTGIFIAIIFIVMVMKISINTFYETKESLTKATESEQITITTEEKILSDQQEDVTTEYDVNKESAYTDGQLPSVEGQANYRKLIREVAKKETPHLVIDGKEYTIPCRYGEIKGDFGFVKEIPETFSTNDDGFYQAKKGIESTGLHFCFSNMSYGDIPNEEVFIDGIDIYDFEGEPTDTSLFGLKIGDSKEKLEASIEKLEELGYRGGFVGNYDVYETYSFENDNGMSFTISFNNEENRIEHLSYDMLMG